MKARLSKKAYRQLHGATHGRIGQRRCILLPMKRKGARRMNPQAQMVAKAG